MEEWLSVARDVYEQENVVKLYSFDEWLALWVAYRTWLRYSEFLRSAYLVGDLRGVDIEDAINGMESFWGIRLEPEVGGDLRISYRYNGAILSMALVYDEVVIEAWCLQVWGAYGESRDRDAVIEGNVRLLGSLPEPNAE